MRTIALLVVVLTFGAAGCGKSDKPDNSHNQTPDGQPLTLPKGPSGNGKPADIGEPPNRPGNPVGKKALPPVEFKP
jgi:hypothetical protein